MLQWFPFRYSAFYCINCDGLVHYDIEYQEMNVLKIANTLVFVSEEYFWIYILFHYWIINDSNYIDIYFY